MSSSEYYSYSVFTQYTTYSLANAQFRSLNLKPVPCTSVTHPRLTPKTKHVVHPHVKPAVWTGIVASFHALPDMVASKVVSIAKPRNRVSHGIRKRPRLGQFAILQFPGVSGVWCCDLCGWAFVIVNIEQPESALGLYSMLS
eukprot:1386967-Amorphochlora_amoeboformis.AAC.1